MARNWDAIEPRGFQPAKQRTHSKAEAYIASILDDAMAQIEKQPYQSKLRVSSLPICGLLHTIDEIEKPDREIPFSMEFYTAQGTAIHLILQRAISRSKRFGRRVVGSWLCNNVNCKHKLHEQLRPARLECQRCNSGEYIYEEFEFDFHGLTGHMDLLTIDRKGRYVVWDFKTTGEYNIQNPDKYLPYPKNVQQIEMYCTLLKILRGIDVHSYTLVYVNRNKANNSDDAQGQRQYCPIVYRFTPEMFERRYTQAKRIIRAAQLSKALRVNPTKEALTKLEAIRPCKSLEQYNDPATGMAHAFFKSDCQYKAGGLCFRDRRGGTAAGMKIASLLGIK